MSFQGNVFVRNQNFTRDRDLGPPEDTISAEKVDNELDNIADGLSVMKQLGETAKSSADAAPAAAVATVRGSVAEAYDTLKKLYDWAVAELVKKLDLTGGTLTGALGVRHYLNVRGTDPQGAEANRHLLFQKGDGVSAGLLFSQLSDNSLHLQRFTLDGTTVQGSLDMNGTGISYNAQELQREGRNSLANFEVQKTDPEIILHYPGKIRYGMLVTSDSRWHLRDVGTGESKFSIGSDGTVSTKQLGDLATYIGARVLRTGDTMTGNLQIQRSDPQVQLHWPGVRVWSFRVLSNGDFDLIDASGGRQLFVFGLADGNLSFPGLGTDFKTVRDNANSALGNSVRDLRLVNVVSVGVGENTNMVLTGIGSSGTAFARTLQRFTNNAGWQNVNFG